MGGLLGGGGAKGILAPSQINWGGGGALPPCSYAYGKSERVMIITKQVLKVTSTRLIN